MSECPYFYVPFNTSFADISAMNREASPSSGYGGTAVGEVYISVSNPSPRLGVGCGVWRFPEETWVDPFFNFDTMAMLPNSVYMDWSNDDSEDLSLYNNGLPDGSTLHFLIKHGPVDNYSVNNCDRSIEVGPFSFSFTRGPDELLAIDVSFPPCWSGDSNIGRTYRLSGTTAEGCILTDLTSWHHFALTYSEGSVYDFMNGVLLEKVTGVDYVQCSQLHIGMQSNRVGYSANRYVAVDEFVISRTALWTDDFTPPTTEAYIPVNSQEGITKLLLHMD